MRSSNADGVPELAEQASIRVSNVSKVFRKSRGFLRRTKTEEWALKGVSLEVRRGETYALLGPNGSGKSTLIRILSTLLLHDGGTVEVEGCRLPDHAHSVRKIVGRVSVDAAFHRRLSAKENLLYSASMYGYRHRSAEKRSLDILEQLGFPGHKFDAPMEEMSRGMQQKVAITRALLVNPPVLLLDEPTTGLDPKSKRDVQAFLEQLQAAEGTTILLTTHDMAEAERLCERIGLLAHGELAAEGTAEDLCRKANASSLDDAFIALTGERLLQDVGEQAKS